MGSCVSLSPDLPTDPTFKHKHKHESHNPSSSPTETNSKLSNNSYLVDEIPNWFPSTNAHKNISTQFIIKDKIGVGVTGSVFTIFYKKTKSLCAMKRIPRDDEFGRMQFTTEAQVLAKLSHPSIIKYIDMLMDDKYYYLILEKCDYDLWSLMSKNKYLSEEKCKKILFGLLSAVNHIHNKNLVHRDIKPENIVFTNDTHMPKLIDFGDAEMAKPDKIYTEFVGTPPYMSPERLGKHNAIELLKSDIWALGVLTYEMYSGQRCFQGATQKQVFGKILRGQWEWNINRKPSAMMKNFVEQCLDLDINSRLSAQDALEHVWFDDIQERIQMKLMQTRHKIQENEEIIMSDLDVSVCEENNENNLMMSDGNVIELCDFYSGKMEMERADTPPPIDEYDVVSVDRFDSIPANIKSSGIIISNQMDEK